MHFLCMKAHILLLISCFIFGAITSAHSQLRSKTDEALEDRLHISSMKLYYATQRNAQTLWTDLPMQTLANFENNVNMRGWNEMGLRLIINKKKFFVHLLRDRSDNILMHFESNVNANIKKMDLPHTGCHYHTLKPKTSQKHRVGAALNICVNGIRGTVIIGNLELRIAPLKPSEVASTKSSNLALFHTVEVISGSVASLAQPDSIFGADLASNRTTSVRDELRRRRREVHLNGAISYQMDLYLVVDFSFFLQFDYSAEQGDPQSIILNTVATIKKVREILSYVNMIYAELDISIVIVGMDILTKRPVSWEEHETNAERLLDGFRNYVKDNVMQRNVSYDCAHLLTAMEDANGGSASVRRMCSREGCHSFSVDKPSKDARTIALTIAHELGHNFGLEHDSARRGCDMQCGETEKCIMYPVYAYNKQSLRWSQCSVEAMQDFLATGMGVCLKPMPYDTRVAKALVVDPRSSDHYLYGTMEWNNNCGNGIVEEGEECDCGDQKTCDLLGNTCCDPKKCLIRGMCDSGPCCDTSACTFKSKGHVCREANGTAALREVGEVLAEEVAGSLSRWRQAQAGCDLPEFCSGDSQWCPADLHKQDGTPCTDNLRNGETEKAFCYHGRCGSHKSQCKLVWGRTGVKGPDTCFNNNKWISTTGIMGCARLLDDGSRKLRRMVKCDNDDDAQCGRLWCKHKNEKRMYYGENVEHISMSESIGSTDSCEAVALDLGSVARKKMEYNSFVDPGLVPNGAPCGANGERMCFNSTCVSPDKVRFNLSKCHCYGNGICNSLGECHCDRGWKPPLCKQHDGCGEGSVSGGRRECPGGSQCGCSKSARATSVLS